MTFVTTNPNIYSALLVVGKDVPEMSQLLNVAIVRASHKAIQDHGVFTIALSGGSLPSFLSSMNHDIQLNQSSNLDSFHYPKPPQYDRWHVLLADERCVPNDHVDSNIAALRKQFLVSQTTIPPEQIYAIDDSLLLLSSSSSQEVDSSVSSTIASEYETNKLKPVLALSGGQLDLAVLGFGPDGHTCSLFPHHKLVTMQPNQTNDHHNPLLVASIDDSPKPPPSRITLTLSMLNTYTRQVIFCGAGVSKAPILQTVFDQIQKYSTTTTTKPTTTDSTQDLTHESNPSESTTTISSKFIVTYHSPPPYPCAMVQPMTSATTTSSTTATIDLDNKGTTEDNKNCSVHDNNNPTHRVTWIVDLDAVQELELP